MKSSHKSDFFTKFACCAERVGKSFIRHEDKELLLYAIKPGETCIISFNAVLANAPSKASALSEENFNIIQTNSVSLFWIEHPIHIRGLPERLNNLPVLR